MDREIETAVHTACMEIPDAHPSDIADCVCGLVGFELYDANEAEIAAMIKRIV